MRPIEFPAINTFLDLMQTNFLESSPPSRLLSHPDTRSLLFSCVDIKPFVMREGREKTSRKIFLFCKVSTFSGLR